MSSIPKGPNDDAAPGAPTPGTHLPRPSLDRTLAGVAPTAVASTAVASTAVAPASAAPAEAVSPEAPATPSPNAPAAPIVAAPVIAVSGGASEQEIEPTPEPVEGSDASSLGPHRADVDPALQRTVVASAYLRAARDAALRPPTVPRPRRPPPSALLGHHEAAVNLRASEARGPEVAATAESSAMELAAGSKATLTSIAPPLEGAPASGETEPLTPVAQRLAAAASAIEEQASAPPAAVPSTQTLAGNAAPGSPAAQGFGRRFEPVPTVRAPLWEQAPPSLGRPLALDNGSADWNPPSAAQASSALRGQPQRSRWYRLRWVALAAAALTAVAFAIFGEKLTRKPAGRVELAESTAVPVVETASTHDVPPEQTTLSNRPASEASVTPPALADVPPVAASPERPTPAKGASAPPGAEATSVPEATDPKPAPLAEKKPSKRSKAKRRRAATPKAPTHTVP